MHHHLALAECARKAGQYEIARAELLAAQKTIECIVDHAANARVTNMLARLDRRQ